MSATPDWLADLIEKAAAAMLQHKEIYDLDCGIHHGCSCEEWSPADDGAEGNRQEWRDHVVPHLLAAVEPLIRADERRKVLGEAADDVLREVRRLEIGCEADAGYYDAHMKIRKMLHDLAERDGE